MSLVTQIITREILDSRGNPTVEAGVSLATKAGQIKTGSACRSDRGAKYNRLLRIEQQPSGRASYSGISETKRR